MAAKTWDEYGATPYYKTYAFLRRVDQVIHDRVAHCMTPRTHTFYFSQAGFDTEGTGENEGDGSLLHPYKTKAKAQYVIAAMGGDTAVLFARGETWDETITLTDGGLPNVLIRGYTKTGVWTAAKPIFDGDGTNVDGVNISGDGSAIIGINSRNWGLAGSGQYYPIRTQPLAGVCCLVMDCEAYTATGPHVIGHYTDAAGGMTTVVRCRASLGEGNSNTVYNGFSGAGSHEFIVDDCWVTGGSGGTGVFGHANNGYYVGLFLTRNLRIKAASSQVGTPVAFEVGNTPDNQWNPSASRVFEINTEIELGAGTCMANPCGVSHGVRIGGVYRMKPPTIPAQGCWFSTSAATQATVYGSIYIVDLSNTTAAGRYGAWNTYTAGFKWENVHTHYQNVPANSYVGLSFQGVWNNPGSVLAGTSIQNSLFTAESVGAGTVMEIGCGVDTVAANNNAQFGFAGDSHDYAFTSDANRIDLDNIVLPHMHPVEGDQLYDAAAVTTDGVRPQFDAKGMRRMVQSIGPLENTAGFYQSPTRTGLHAWLGF